MRYVIYGPGGVGGTIAARLHQHGRDVVLVARGEHGRVLREQGLKFVAPDGAVTLPIPTVVHPSELDWQGSEMVLLTVKSQQSASALTDLAGCAPADIGVVFAQNGVANEPLALRHFRRVYGMLINLPAMHLRPGEVASFGEGVSGLLDTGCYPSGVDAAVTQLTDDLAHSGFLAEPDPHIMRKKYAKLLLNLGNVLEAATNGATDVADLAELLQQEAHACFAAANIECAEVGAAQGVGRPMYRFAQIPGYPRFGGSSWQSVERGTGDIETDFLNGEVVWLGRLYGVPTPANEYCQRLARSMLRDALPVGHFTSTQLREAIAAARV